MIKPLTTDDLCYHCSIADQPYYGYTVSTHSVKTQKDAKKLISYILKNQEKAKKWDENQQSGMYVSVHSEMLKMENNAEIVQRLKKRLEESNPEFDPHWFRNELQVLLGEKK